MKGENVKSSFNFFSANAKWIECIFKTVFEFVLLRPSRSLVSSFTPIVGLMNLRIFYLKILSVSELRMLESNLFHSIMVDRIYEFLKNWCFTLTWGILSAFLVLYGQFDCGIISKRYFGHWFLYTLKKRQFSRPTSLLKGP